MKKYWFQKHPKKALLLFLLTIFLFIFVSFEIILRCAGMGYGDPPCNADPFMHHVHPSNYRQYCHTPSGEYGGFSIYYNEEGLDDDPNEIKKGEAIKSKNRVAFLGDSFVEARQVAYDKKFTTLLKSDTSQKHLQIKNYGVSSYSPSLSYIQWRRQVSQFKPTHVFLLLYSNDVRNDNQYMQNAIYDDNKKLAAIPGPPERAYIWLRNFYIIRYIRKIYLQAMWVYKGNAEGPVVGGHVEENPNLLESKTAEIVLNLNVEVKKNKGKFILMAVPSKYNLQGEGQKIEDFATKCQSWAAQKGIDFIDLKEAFSNYSNTHKTKLFFDVDIHFNEQGHEVVAETIKKSFPKLFTEN